MLPFADLLRNWHTHTLKHTLKHILHVNEWMNKGCMGNSVNHGRLWMPTTKQQLGSRRARFSCSAMLFVNNMYHHRPCSELPVSLWRWSGFGTPWHSEAYVCSSPAERAPASGMASETGPDSLGMLKSQRQHQDTIPQPQSSVCRPHRTCFCSTSKTPDQTHKQRLCFKSPVLYFHRSHISEMEMTYRL